MTMPKPPGSFPKPAIIEKPDGKLEPDEYKTILDTCLTFKDRSDPIIISFIDSFVRCKIISQACEENSIHYSLGYKWRHKKSIANVIQKLIDRSAVKHGFDSSEILERVKEIVDFDPIAIVNPDGSYKSNLNDIAPEARRNIKKLEVKNIWNETEDLNGIKGKIIVGEIIKYEFYDKLKSAELAGKEKEMFKNTTKVLHAPTQEMTDILLASKNRGEKFIENNMKEVKDAEVINVPPKV